MLVLGRVLFRTALARLLAAEPDFDLVAECANPVEAMVRLETSGPDVVLCDFDIWSAFISPARNAGYSAKFLAVTEEIDAAACALVLREGISGIVLGSESSAHLIQAIRVIVSGGTWLDQNLIRLLADRYPRHEDLRLSALPEREHAVLRGILDGLSNRRIADRIGTSESTVKATLQQLFDKTGVRTRSQLIRIMIADANNSGDHAENSGRTDSSPAPI